MHLWQTRSQNIRVLADASGESAPPAHLSNPRQRVEETLDALPVRTISMHQIDILVIAVHFKPLACPHGDAAACATLVAAIL